MAQTMEGGSRQSSRWLIYVLTAALLAMGTQATAQQFPPDNRGAATYNIAAQPLRAALDAFARQSGLQVSADASLIAGQRAQAVSGTYTPEQALGRLLAGTDLSGYVTDSGTVVLARLPTLGAVRAGDDTLVLSPVVIEAATPEPRQADQSYQSAGSSAYIGRDEIQRNRGMSVGDIFGGLTGVLVAEMRNSGGLNVNIRGMQGQGRVPVLVDGTRQETTVSRGYAGVTSRSYVDPALIGSIEVDKGPVMGPYGMGANGGIVHMNTLAAGDIAKDGKTWGVLLRGGLIGNNSGSLPPSGTPAGYGVGPGGPWGFSGNASEYRVDCLPGLESLCSGQYDIANAYGTDATMDRPSLLDFNGHAASIAVTKRFANVDLVAAYAERQQGNYYAGENGLTPSLDLTERYDRGFYTEVRPNLDGATRFRGNEQIVNTHFDSQSTLLKSTFYMPAMQSLELSYMRYDSEYGQLMPSQLLWFGRVRQTEPSTVTVNTYNARYKWEPVDLEWVDLDVQVWHTDLESENNSYSKEMLEFIADGNEVGAEAYGRWGGHVSNTMQLPALGDFQIEYGVSYQHERIEPKNGVTTPTGPMRDGERQTTSAYTALKWEFLSTLTLDAGIRYTHFQVQDNKQIALFNPDHPYCRDYNGDGSCDLLPGNENSDSGYAPMASLTWEPIDGVNVYYTYAEALRMPSMFESTAGFSVAPAIGADLKPEHTINHEIGINVMQRGLFANDDVLRARVAYFNNRTEDYLTRTIPNTWEGSGFFRMRNIDSVEFNGVELALEYDLGWVFLKAAGTRYSDIEVCHTGSYRRQRCTDYGVASSYFNNMIPPNWEANATLGFRLFDETLTLGTQVNWMGERNEVPEYNSEVSRGFAQPIPWHAYTTADVFLTWQPNDTFTLDFTVDNITDEYYINALSLGMVPAPGRTAHLSATLHF